MRNREILGLLAEYDYTFRRLSEFWERIKEAIKAPLPKGPDGEIEFEGYRVGQEEEGEGSAIYFRLFGARCYVAFTHNLSTGRLEYGVIDPTCRDERRRIPCSAPLEFDSGANLGPANARGICSVLERNSVQAAHLWVVSQAAQELVKTYYDAGPRALPQRLAGDLALLCLRFPAGLGAEASAVELPALGASGVPDAVCAAIEAHQRPSGVRRAADHPQDLRSALRGL